MGAVVTSVRARSWFVMHHPPCAIFCCVSAHPVGAQCCACAARPVCRWASKTVLIVRGLTRTPTTRQSRKIEAQAVVHVTRPLSCHSTRFFVRAAYQPYGFFERNGFRVARQGVVRLWPATFENWRTSGCAAHMRSLPQPAGLAAPLLQTLLMVGYPLPSCVALTKLETPKLDITDSAPQSSRRRKQDADRLQFRS
jgi:hypothetical protein